MKRYWASWWDASEDPPESSADGFVRMLGVWDTGHRTVHGISGDRAEVSFCALVEADFATYVQLHVEARRSVTEWRFVTLKPDDWTPPADRFPVDQQAPDAVD